MARQTLAGFANREAKFLQQKELELQDELAKKAKRWTALARKREQFAVVAQAALDRNAQGALWEEVRAWMKSEDLLEVHSNLQTYTALEHWAYGLRNASSDANVERNAANLATTIRSIEVPTADGAAKPANQTASA